MPRTARRDTLRVGPMTASQKIEYRLKNSPASQKIEYRLKNSPLHLLTQKRELELALPENLNYDSSLALPENLNYDSSGNAPASAGPADVGKSNFTGARR